MSGVEKLRGDEMDAYLRRHPTVLYRYLPNHRLLVFLFVLAVITGASGVWLLWTSGLVSVGRTLAIAALIGTAGSLTVVAGYWTYFTRVYWVAVSDRHLLIGKGRHVKAVDWGALDLGTLDFAGESDGESLGVLALELDDAPLKLRLFNGFAILENLHSFISALLEHVKDSTAEAAEVAEVPPEGDA